MRGIGHLKEMETIVKGKKRISPHLRGAFSVFDVNILVNPWSHVTVHWQGIFLFTSTIQPLVFLRPLTWGMSCPLCIRLTLRLRRCSFPHSKSQENYGGFR